MPDLTINIIFKHRNFAALQADEVPADEKLNGEKLWPYPNDVLLDHRFANFQAPKCSVKYSGTIAIHPIRYDLESFEKNMDRELDMQKTPHGYLRLPTAVLEANITIEDVPSKIYQILLWYSKLIERIDYETIAREDTEKLNDFETNHQTPMGRVKHGNPGIGATKSSAYVPLK